MDPPLLHYLSSHTTAGQDFYRGIERFVASSALSVLFGKRAPQYSTKEVTEFFHSERLYEKILDPGAQPPVDMLPFLKYVPEWMGASWKGLCRELRQLRRSIFLGLLTELEERNSSGDYNGSCIEIVKARAKEWGLDKEQLG